MSSHSKIRYTTQRQVILEELQKLSSHPTASELYQVVRKRLPHISLGTVYRNLEILSQAGRIHTLQLAGSEKRFDGRVDNHYHMRCVRCGRVEDLPLPPLRAIDDAVQTLSDYEILSYRIEFAGICAQCKQVEQRRA